jgi:hypothetical protein
MSNKEIESKEFRTNRWCSYQFLSLCGKEFFQIPNLVHSGLSLQ